MEHASAGKVPAKYRELLPAGSMKGGSVVVLDNLHLRDVVTKRPTSWPRCCARD